MRRVLVASVVLFIAACGGGVRSEAKPEAAQRNAIPTDQESALLIESLTKAFGSDAVDSCLAAWQDTLLGTDTGPVSKPGAQFRRFISQCVGAPVPADLRRDAVDSLRADTSSDMRANRAADVRSVFTE
jgi:hypothetical protein